MIDQILHILILLTRLNIENEDQLGAQQKKLKKRKEVSSNRLYLFFFYQ